MSYITYTDVQNFLEVSLTPAEQTVVNDLIAAFEAFIDDFCNRTWTKSSSTDITEQFDGGTDTFLVKYPPVSSIQSVTIDGSNYTLGDVFNYGSYIVLATIPGKGFQNVIIIYRTTANTIPADLKHVIVRWVADIFKSHKDAGKSLSRLSVGSISMEYTNQESAPNYVKEVINKYRLTPKP